MLERVVIHSFGPTYLKGDPDLTRSTLERWLLESVPAADGVTFIDQPDGRVSVEVWRQPEAAQFQAPTISDKDGLK